MGTGGPFSLSVNGRGESVDAKGSVPGSGVYVDAFEVEGPITCMRVEGNRASIKYRFKRASGPGAFDAAAGICTDPRLDPAGNRIETGDFSVRDAG